MRMVGGNIGLLTAFPQRQAADSCSASGTVAGRLSAQIAETIEFKGRDDNGVWAINEPAC